MSCSALIYAALLTVFSSQCALFKGLLRFELCPFLRRSPLIQQTQIRLPSNRNDASENAPVVYGYICKTESGEDRPHLAAVHPACGHRVLDPFDDLGYSCAGKDGMHAEEE